MLGWEVTAVMWRLGEELPLAMGQLSGVVSEYKHCEEKIAETTLLKNINPTLGMREQAAQCFIGSASLLQESIKRRQAMALELDRENVEISGWAGVVMNVIDGGSRLQFSSTTSTSRADMLSRVTGYSGTHWRQEK